MKSKVIKSLIAATAAVSLASCAGGPIAQTGTVGGAALGAVAGGVIGHQSGHTAEGALIGGVLGGAAGNAIGNSQDQRNYYNRYRY